MISLIFLILGLAWEADFVDTYSEGVYLVLTVILLILLILGRAGEAVCVVIYGDRAHFC